MRISDWSSDVCSSDLASNVVAFSRPGPAISRAMPECSSTVETEGTTMDSKTLARLGAVVFVAIAPTAAAIEMTEKESPTVQPAETAAASASDPLRDELIQIRRAHA